MEIKQFGLLGAGLLMITLLKGQDSSKMSREEYINTFSELAMREMARVRIPASITLAQACLESDNGNSRLAVRGNNHFGIKCHDWKGKKIYHDDDERRECFRSYPSVYDSFMDHSRFLTSKSRYAALFELKLPDYRGWARGLKKAGYATSPKYAEMLIRIIEENGLYRYDNLVIDGGLATGPDSTLTETAHGYPSSRTIFVNNRIEYILIQPGDTPESLRDELELYRSEIYRYNNLYRGAKLVPGQIIYLQPKRRKAARGNEIHVVEEGQTMHDISQIYGVKQKYLYKRNLMTEGKQPPTGSEIYLRRKKREPVFELEPIEEEPSEEEMQFNFESEIF